MSALWVLVIVLLLACLGYVAARRRAIASADGDVRRLHSLPVYYGTNAVLLTAVPALLVLAGWLVVQPLVVEQSVHGLIPEAMIDDGANMSLVMSDVARVADGLDALVAQGKLTRTDAGRLRTDFTPIRDRLASVGVAVGDEVNPDVLRAAQATRSLNRWGAILRAVVVLALAAAGLATAWLRTDRDFRARNTVELAIKSLLILASSIAILTTLGIVLSMLFETLSFFQQYSVTRFLFGTTWSPNFRGNSDLGILPLLWGTLYISFIALAVSVPIGLFAAIYMSEYATPRIRSVAKPAIEILAGIPTIVYGLFALITVGPLLRDYFAQPMGLGQSGASVMTAGLVMGIMLIPFVSSLSDDIISAVPQSMRDGSLGLGATRSETIRQVVIPAALPGIVGAILLAASRAIGETMIVVLGAGAAARLSLNPFEAMTTVTVKIVSQLTGDTDFAAPETLVAFALGLTLFVITLGLNVIALFIVRRYREQYE